ncbi:MAG: YihY/virulence factor BrkB family protein [Anaerolineaceae bacterium]|nr:YihY/virulence factor BrkB family protein [Anaerolineaceae bacterium]
MTMKFKEITYLSHHTVGIVKSMDIDQIKSTSLMILRKINHITGGLLSIMRDAFGHFAKDRAVEAAATIAYFSIFSIFPLIIGIISLASNFLEASYVRQNLVTYITNTFPISSGLIITNIQVVLDQRGTVGVLALGGLIWSATAMFNTLALNLDRAWPDADSHNVLERRLVAIAMFVSLAALLIATILLSATLDVLPHFNIKLWGTLSTYETTIWKIFSNIGPFILRFGIIYAIYRFVPKAYVPSNSAFWGALFATSGWELVTTLITGYFSTGLVQYELIYGSLGRIIALMLWIYASSIIILLGAYISAAHDRYRKSQKIQA